MVKDALKLGAIYVSAGLVSKKLSLIFFLCFVRVYFVYNSQILGFLPFLLPLLLAEVKNRVYHKFGMFLIVSSPLIDQWTLNQMEILIIWIQ